MSSLLRVFVKVVTFICHRNFMYLSKLLHAFVKVFDNVDDNYNNDDNNDNYDDKDNGDGTSPTVWCRQA